MQRSGGRVGALAAGALLAIAVGAAPGRATVASDLCPATSDPCLIDVPVAITPGSVIDVGARTLELGPQATLDVGAGTLVLRAGVVRLRPGARVLGRDPSAGGNVVVQAAGAIEVQASGPSQARIDVSSEGAEGLVQLEAGGDVTIAGQLVAVGTDPFANGGGVSIDAGGSVVVTTTGDLLVAGGSQASGGSVRIDAGGGVDVQNTLEAAGGDFGGGDVEIVARGGDIVLRSQVNVPGGGFSGDGGFVALDASGSVQVLATVDGHAAGDSEDGAGSGGDVDIRAGQAIVLAGPLSLASAPPDGEGGSVSLDAGGTITQSAAILAEGQGVDGCGGSVLMSAGAPIALHRLTLSGGACGGGSALVSALGDLAVSQPVVADGAGGGTGGTIDLAGRNVSIGSVVRAAANDGGVAGEVTVRGCDVTIGSSAELRTIGIAGRNVVEGSGRVTIAGKLLSTTGVLAGENRVAYRSATLPPAFTGATVSPPPVLVVDPLLPPCPAEGALCGDGVREGGEQCDDGNATACDGCSASCRLEACGNARVECDEECDNGTANGTAGNACAVDCTIIPTPGGIQLIPGGRTSTACQLEWRVRNPGGEIVDGFPSTQQRCYDGDPGCDRDESNDGRCTFDLGACLAATDTRLPTCQPTGLQYVNVKKPNLLTTTDPVDRENATLVHDALAATGVTLRVGTTVVTPGASLVGRDVCTASVPIVVPHFPGLVGTRTLEAAARDLAGSRMRDNHVDLVCLPNPSVCGDGVTGVGEQCDDGNAAACDGCTPTCRREGCGDGIVECGEACDDGAANGSDASNCTLSCTEKVPPLRVPGGGSSLSDCLLEFALATAAPTLDKKGLPARKQSCTDGDPGCDFDPTPGVCGMKLWACLGGEDVRIGCVPQTVASVAVLKPSIRDASPLAEVRAALLDRLAALPLPASGGETCTSSTTLTVPVARRPLTIAVQARDPSGRNDRDTLKLRCLAPPP